MAVALMRDEERRLEALRSLAVLDTAPEPEFDNLVQLARLTSEASIALISLVDRERQFFKARAGIEIAETPRAGSFCTYAIEQDNLFVVHDAARDRRFSHHPLVSGPPFIRFYAGMPLLTPEGAAVGTLCVIDASPRALTKRQGELLELLGREVSARLEARRSARARDGLAGRLEAELRAALTAIRRANDLLLGSGELGEETGPASLRVRASVEEAEQAVEDFVGLSDGGGAPSRAALDLGVLCREVAADLTRWGPPRSVEVATSGDAQGNWDKPAMERSLFAVFTALAGDAIGAPLAVEVRGLESAVLLRMEPVQGALGICRALSGACDEDAPLALRLAGCTLLAQGGKARIDPATGALELCLPRTWRHASHGARG